MGKRRARHASSFRQCALREVAHVSKRNQIAREIGGDELGSIHTGAHVRGSDIPPLQWTGRLDCRRASLRSFAHMRKHLQPDMQTPRVLITGGTSGLCLALVRELRARGASVAFVARTAERVAAVAREHGAHGIVGDVAQKHDIHRIALQALGELGGLDVLVNNASDLGPTPLALLGDTDCEDLERALATNLVGPFRLTKALLGALSASAREGRGAVILNVSSDAAINAYPTWGAYSASKAGLHHLIRIWAPTIG